jgi:hypothetical protein
LFVNRHGNFLFCLEIANRFITGAEPAYHGPITVEVTSNLDGFHTVQRCTQAPNAKVLEPINLQQLNAFETFSDKVTKIVSTSAMSR